MSLTLRNPLTGSTPDAGRRRLGALVAACAVALALTGCSGGGEPTRDPATTVEGSIDPDKQAPPEPVIPPTWPLTGVASDAIVERPALAVKIENTSAARPQSGLEAADVVWETIVEFEVSRFVAVFHSTLPEEIGPIRSVRPMDPKIAGPLKGLLAYSGGQPGILALVQSSGLQSVSHDSGNSGMYRVGFRSAPHNVYAKPADLVAKADATHAASPPEQFTFATAAEQATALTEGTPAQSIAFQLSAAAKPSWAWDAASGRWLRSEGSAAATVASGAQISATNVVAVRVDSFPSGFGAQNGASVPDLGLQGGGEALVASGGHTIVGQWQKAGPNEPLRLLTADGRPLDLAPGNTWVELVNNGSGSYTLG